MNTLLQELDTAVQNAWWLTLPNPLVEGDADRLRWRLLEYSGLPARIVSILSSSASRLSQWPNTRAELLENVRDESGARTGGVPHYQILVRELQAIFGVDIEAYRYGESTERYLQGVKKSIAEESESTVAGMALALEATAIPELRTVAELINTLATALGKTMPISLNSAVSWPLDGHSTTLSNFFAAHIGRFEIDHRDHLAEAIEADLSSVGSRAEVVAGFKHGLALLDQWFSALK